MQMMCQQSWSYMDDDVCVCREYTLVGKSGGIRPRMCSKYTRVGKMYSAASCAQTCKTTAYSQLLVIILLTAGLARGPRSELSLILVNMVLFMYKSDLIVAFLVIVMLISRLSKYVKFMILPVALST